MGADIHPVNYASNHYTVMANDVIRGKQEMTLQEARIIRLLITQVVKEDKDLKTYVMNINDLAKFLNIPKSNLYRDIYNICDSLLQRVVRIGSGDARDSWTKFQWIQLARYDGHGNITLMLSEQIKPYVIELEKYFTQYKLENILEMNSFYAIRLYELLKCDDFTNGDTMEYSIDFLRQFFDCEDKYKPFNDFKKRVIDISIKEINAKSDIEIRNLEYVKEGRRVTALRFELHYNVKVELRRSREAMEQLGLEGAYMG
ncbi:replication initiation protein [Ruminococcaceae bacterium OttesenSCG-928-L11]|nr:replication initiation protein [Ruminococcaceae bacterium OttesenSCG-928-L11]